MHSPSLPSLACFVVALDLILLSATSPAATLTVTNNADSGAGSLRDTLAAAAPDDTIVFDAGLSGQTITLGSQLTLTRNVTIDASALPGGLTVSITQMA